MARLPKIIANQGVPTIAGPVRADPAAMAINSAVATRALGDASRELFDFADRQQKIHDTIELAKASSAATGELDAFRVELDKDGDYATKAERFKTKSAEIKAKYAGRFSGDALARFEATFGHTASGMELSVRHAARRDEIQNGIVALDTANDDLVGKAANARNDVERDGYLGQVNDNLKGALEGGILTAAQHGARKRVVLGKFEEAMAQRLIRTTPAAAIAALDDPKRFTFMDPVRREVLKGQAQTKLEAQGAQARLEARFDGQDLIQSYRDGILPEDADGRLAKVKVADPRLGARIDTERRVFASVQEFRGKSLVDQVAVLKGYEEKAAADGLARQQRLEYERMLQLHQKQLQLFTADAFTASLATSSTVRELHDRAQAAQDPALAATSREAALEWQAKNGVPAMDRAVVSKAQVQQMVRELATLDGPAFDQRMRQLKESYGGHFEILRRQLATEGKAEGRIPGFATMLDLPDTPQGITARANLQEARSLKAEDIKKAVPSDTDLGTLRKTISDELADLRSSLAAAPGGAATIARYADDAERLAATFVVQGAGVKDAGKRAVDQLVHQHYSFVSDRNDSRVRVPRVLEGAVVPIDVVRDNLDTVRQALPTLELAVPPDATPGADAKVNAEAFARRVQVYGRWLTLEGGRGAILTYEAAGRIQPVLMKGGKPVVVMFNEPRRPSSGLPVESEPAMVSP